MPTEKKTTHKAKENDAEKKVAPTEAVTVKDEAPSTANVKPADSAAPKAEEAPKPAPRTRYPAITGRLARKAKRAVFAFMNVFPFRENVTLS